MVLTEISTSTPSWASYWLINPPAWVLRVTYLAILVVVGGGAWGYRRHGLTPDVLEEVSVNMITFFASLSLASTLVSLQVPLLAVVAIGGVGGWAVANGFERTVTVVTDS